MTRSASQPRNSGVKGGLCLLSASSSVSTFGMTACRSRRTTFLLLSIVFIIVAHGYFQTHSIRWLVGLGLVAGLSAVTRYAGVSLIALGGLLLLCDGRMRWSPRKFGHWALYGFVAVLPLALNLYRNLRLT